MCIRLNAQANREVEQQAEPGQNERSWTAAPGRERKWSSLYLIRLSLRPRNKEPRLPSLSLETTDCYYFLFFFIQILMHNRKSWGLVLAETRPAQWVTLHSIDSVGLFYKGDVVRWLFMNESLFRPRLTFLTGLLHWRKLSFSSIFGDKVSLDSARVNMKNVYCVMPCILVLYSCIPGIKAFESVTWIPHEVTRNSTVTRDQYLTLPMHNYASNLTPPMLPSISS